MTSCGRNEEIASVDSCQRAAIYSSYATHLAPFPRYRFGREFSLPGIRPAVKSVHPIKTDTGRTSNTLIVAAKFVPPRGAAQFLRDGDPRKAGRPGDPPTIQIIVSAKGIGLRKRVPHPHPIGTRGVEQGVAGDFTGGHLPSKRRL